MAIASVDSMVSDRELLAFMRAISEGDARRRRGSWRRRRNWRRPGW